MKRITAYKLLKDLPDVPAGTLFHPEFREEEGGDCYVARCNEDDEYWYSKADAERLTDWFEPVYAPQFKVGDWVWAKNYDGNGLDSLTKNLVQIVENPGDQFVSGLTKYNQWDFIVRQYGHYYRVNSVTAEFEMATAKQVQEAQRVNISGYDLEVSGNQAKWGCKSFTKDQLLAYKHLLDTTNSTITVNKTEITTEILNKVLARF